MKTPTKRRPHPGYTLVLTLIILAAVTILVVSIFTTTMGGQQTASSNEAAERAEMALQAGMARVSGMLDELTGKDDFFICTKPLVPDTSSNPSAHQVLKAPTSGQTTPPPINYLIGARYESTTQKWNYVPLLSGIQPPSPSAAQGTIALPDQLQRQATPSETSTTIGNPGSPLPILRTLPWQARPEVYWEEISLPAENGTGTGELSARYAFWVEDMQGFIPQEAAGNSSGTGSIHARVDHTQPAPGLNVADPSKPLLNQLALYSIISPTSTVDGTKLDDAMIQNRTMLVSSETWKEAFIAQGAPNGLTSDSFKRDASGHYVDASARAIEENTIAGVRPYREKALIPPNPAFDWVKNGLAQPPKLNLNKLLSEIESATDETARQTKAREHVETIASHIRSTVPKFEQRAGGYPIPTAASLSDKRMNYLRTLAAGIIDYADSDNIPTTMDNATMAYRGMDACPLVNEQWNRWKWDRVYTESGSKFVEVSVTTYLELWNPTNQPVSGEVKALFEDNASLAAGFTSVVFTTAARSTVQCISGKPDDEAGALWQRPVSVTLQPNQFTVVAFTPVVFKLRVGAASASIPLLNPSDDITSRYGLRFRPTGASNFYLVDYSRGGLERNNRKLYFPGGTSNQNQRFNTTVPAMSYGTSSVGGVAHEANNVSDMRASFFINRTQELVNYNNGSSPYGRNLRDNVGAEIIYGSQRISYLPDGGHDTSATGVVHATAGVSNDLTNPDAATFSSRRPATEPDKYLQRISNAGKLWSLTELGNVFDPIMWDPLGRAATNTSTDDSTWSDFANLSSLATESPRHCGGNTLRIGRAEHPLFAAKSIPNATALLDLFHVGVPWASRMNDDPTKTTKQNDTANLTGDLIEIRGHVNINTATRDTLRAVVAGKLMADPAIRDAGSTVPGTVQPAASVTGSSVTQADIIADAIIQNRPYISLSQLPEKLVKSGVCLLGNNLLKFGVTDNVAKAKAQTNQSVTEWNDAAAEEVFSRIYNSSTVRSRNFRVFITAQAVRKIKSDGTVRVLATRSREFNVFVRPPEPGNGITKQFVEITYVRSL